MKWEYWVYGMGSLILLLIVIGIGYWFLKRRFTRERFVFVAFSVHSFHATTIILELLSVPSLTEFLIVSAQKWGFNIPFIKPSPEYIVGSAFIWFCLMVYSYLIFNKWNSPIKTTRQAQEEKEQLKASILADFRAEFKHIIGLEKLALYTGEKDKENKRKLLNQVDSTPLAWHRNAAELLPLIGKYRIDEEEWDKELRCFISTYRNEHPVCIYCIHEAPKDDHYNILIDCLQEEHPTIKHIVVMIEDGNKPKVTTKQGNFKITIYYKATLLDTLIDVSDYQRHLQQLFYNEGTMRTDIALDEIYVPLDYYETTEEEERKALQPFIQDWLDNDTSNRHLALLGEYGQGKSVQSLRLALDLLEAKHPRIPLLITLGGLSPRTLNPLSLLGGWGGHYDFKAKALLKLHREGRLLLIFDGFDEMDLVGDPEMRFQHFETLWQFAKSPKAKILITGRPNFFLDDAEEKRSLGIDRPAHPNSSYCETIHLRKMNLPQIKQALRATEPEIQQSILSKIAENPKGNLYDLASRPSTLFQIGCVWEPAKFHEYKDKLYAAIVIKEFIQFSYERQELKHNKPFLTTDERHYFMQGIAVSMVNEDESKNQISPESLREIVHQLYDNIPDNLPSTSTSHQTSRKPLKERNKEAPSPKESTLIDVCACGLLIKDPMNGHGFKFAHKSFLEYLFSDFCAARLLGQQENVVSALDPLYTKASLRFSETTFNLVAELIAQYYNLDKNPQKKMLNEITSRSSIYIKIHFASKKTAAIALVFSISSMFLANKNKEALYKAKVSIESSIKHLNSVKKEKSILDDFLLINEDSQKIAKETFEKVTTSSETIKNALEKSNTDLKIAEKNLAKKKASLLYSTVFLFLNFIVIVFLTIIILLNFLNFKSKKIKINTLIQIWYLSCIKMGINRDALYRIVPSKSLNEIINISRYKNLLKKYITQNKKTPQP